MDESPTPDATLLPAHGSTAPQSPRLVGRRRVLQVLGVGAVTVHFSGTIEHGLFSPVRALLERTLTEPAEVVGPLAINETFRTEVVRARDFLHLTFVFYNLELHTTGANAGQLARKKAGVAAYIVVEFPPQHIAERAFIQAEVPPWPAPPVAAFPVGPSRLAFKVPTNRTAIPYTLPALLDWSRLSLTPNLVATADAPGGALVEPAPTQTAIEVPYDLYLSPGKDGEWAHAVQPSGSRVELWNTRLGTHHNTAVGDPPAPPDEPPVVPAHVRAVWPETPAADPFRLPLAGTFRQQLVRNMASWTVGGYTPLPATVDFLALTALGASTTLRGDWDQVEVSKVSSAVIEWRQRTAIGRDNYTRVVEAGFLFPLGHEARRVTTTERVFHAATQTGDITAYLFQSQYIEVPIPTKSFPAFGQPNSGRKFPFKSVRITNTVTPPLQVNTDDYEWPTLASDGSELIWKVSLVDLDDRTVTMTMPLAFVTAKNNTAFDWLWTLINVAGPYSSSDPASPRRTHDVGGQKIAYADTKTPTEAAHPPKPDVTSFPTANALFTAEVTDSDPGATVMAQHHQPQFYPAIQSSVVRVPAIEQVTGQPVGPAGGIAISFNAKYLSQGFAPSNFGGAFADVPTPPNMKIPADLAGGIATPQQAVTALSRDLGPVGGNLPTLQDLKQFNPAQVLGGLPKLFGSIALTDILPIVPLNGLADLLKIPATTSELIFPNGDRLKPPQALHSHLHWIPQLQDSPGGIFTANLEGKPASLRLDIDTLVPIASPDKTITDVDADLQSFTISLFGTSDPTHFIDLKFDRLRFRSKTGSKPSVDVELDEVVFTGPLTFVKTLSDFLGSLSGPSIDVSGQGVAAGYSISLPTLSVGVVSLQNISFGGSIFLPFTDFDKMRVRFNFCTREHPFLVTVSLFGGGGFFAVALGVDGLEMLEASIEFGGNFAFDIGVASGGVHVMAGIYFKITRAVPGPDKIELSGFLRLGGELEVLGLITVSLEFVLSFTYKSVGKAYGKATLTVKVEIAFFSASVKLSVEKQFAGGEGDPNFADMLTAGDWSTYCAAFAA